MRASKYPPEFRERSARIARELDRPIAAIARGPGMHHDTLRVRVRQDEADDGTLLNYPSKGCSTPLFDLSQSCRRVVEYK